MRKRKLIIAVLLFALILPLFAGCQTKDTLYRQTLSDELKTKVYNRIIIDHDDKIFWDINEGSAEPYYGTINGCIIVQAIKADQMFTGLERGLIEIAGYEFRTPNPIDLYAYRDGEACELKEAYEKGWLTEKHIAEIHEKHKELYRDWLEHWEKANSK